MSNKLDTRSIGLDVGLSLVRWLTGEENLHYGFWEGLDVAAANLGAAQNAYTDRLLKVLPPPPARILDIGGGAGQTARKLLSLGYEVEIVVPSAFLAGRCRVNAPGAKVHEMKFEDYAGSGPFDICLFSESFQYIPEGTALDGCLRVLAPDGVIVIADCFRTEKFRNPDIPMPIVGGGHLFSRFAEARDARDLVTASDEDITSAVAPSVDLEQEFYNVLGHGLTRLDSELAAKRPWSRRFLGMGLRAVLNQRRRTRLWRRLVEKERNSEVFGIYNTYRIMVLKRPDPSA